MSDYPVKEHSTWGIHDASKIQTFMECPRKYFYRNVVGWEKEIPNVHLVFGEGWHRAMEHLLLHGYEAKSIQGAFDAFNSYYREHFHESSDHERHPKVPESVLPALIGYTNQYKHDNFEVLHTEIAGTVPVSQDRYVNWRIDAVVKDKEGVFALEHKTGSRLMKAWSDQWYLSMQISTYTHVLYCLYEPNEVYGVRVNGSIFRKRDQEFVRVPIRKGLGAMKVWLDTVNHYLDMIEWSFESLQKVTPEDATMNAFPMNTTSCTKYGTCPYFDFCITWENPVERITSEETPMGFNTRWWNPADREKTANKVVTISEEDAQIKKENKDGS